MAIILRSLEFIFASITNLVSQILYSPSSSLVFCLVADRVILAQQSVIKTRKIMPEKDGNNYSKDK